MVAGQPKNSREYKFAQHILKRCPRAQYVLVVIRESEAAHIGYDGPENLIYLYDTMEKFVTELAVNIEKEKKNAAKT